MAHRPRTPALPRPLPRSFILDHMAAPRLKRTLEPTAPGRSSEFELRMASNPYAAILASPIRMCIYTRKILPNGMMTRLIQAAPPHGSEDNRPWIVPDRILPTDTASSRAGASRWAFSRSDILAGVAKEGKYKILSAWAHMRPDTAELVYAQWTIRVAKDFQVAVRDRKRGARVFTAVKQVNAGSDASQDSLETNNDIAFEIPENRRLQCVLHFKSYGHESTRADSTADKNPPDLGALPSKAAVPSISLPTFMPRSQLQSEVSLCRKGTSCGRVPMYDMDLLFHNNPKGLEAILKTFLDQVKDPMSLLADEDGLKIGLTAAPHTVELAQGLFKLVSMHPDPSQ
ncbi:hypothetical protein EMPS_11546 [Entomortierella parvispora]|uniref:Uncharacterized protein n=1 Tax=Entomortierella parvispora TaxID=205924 RepID=A0A9P3HP11_9FUNG|nr:hypothetical protein EMPS_11546 [Entomortierella parvispora]